MPVAALAALRLARRGQFPSRSRADNSAGNAPDGTAAETKSGFIRITGSHELRAKLTCSDVGELLFCAELFFSVRFRLLGELF